jgi:hypothetical protein
MLNCTLATIRFEHNVAQDLAEDFLHHDTLEAKYAEFSVPCARTNSSVSLLTYLSPLRTARGLAWNTKPCTLPPMLVVIPARAVDASYLSDPERPNGFRFGAISTTLLRFRVDANNTNPNAP